MSHWLFSCSFSKPGPSVIRPTMFDLLTTFFPTLCAAWVVTGFPEDFTACGLRWDETLCCSSQGQDNGCKFGSCYSFLVPLGRIACLCPILCCRMIRQLTRESVPRLTYCHILPLACYNIQAFNLLSVLSVLHISTGKINTVCNIRAPPNRRIKASSIYDPFAWLA